MSLSDEPFAVWSCALRGVPGAAPLIIAARSDVGELLCALSDIGVAGFESTLFFVWQRGVRRRCTVALPGLSTPSGLASVWLL